MAWRQATPKGLYRSLHRFADSFVGGKNTLGPFDQALLKAIRQTKAQINERKLMQALREVQVTAPGQRIDDRIIQQALDAIGVGSRLEANLERAYEHLIRRIFNGAAIRAAAARPGLKGVRFDLPSNPNAIKAARVQSAKLVKRISSGTRAGIRREIERGFTRQRTVQKTAKAIEGVLRPKDVAQSVARAARRVIGLHGRQVRTLNKYEKQLRKDGLSDEAIESKLDLRGEKMLRQRARAIARTETIVAANRGHVETWKQSAKEGLFDGKKARRRWVITRDKRTCWICKAIVRMNPKGVPLDKPFKGPKGPVMNAGMAHTHDRCAEALWIDE